MIPGMKVFSEIGRLRRVMVHRPGLEIDWMVPSMMEELLFDDILHGDTARREHQAFRTILQSAGVETLDPEELLTDVLADNQVRDELLDRLARFLHISGDVIGELGRLETGKLAQALISGIRNDRPTQRRKPQFYSLPPLPNYFFQRDPQIVLGDRVLISSMATEAREREPLLARSLFEHHPALKPAEILTLEEHSLNEDWAYLPHVEGGDVLVPSDDVLIIGRSERTNRRGVETMARRLRDSGAKFRVLLVVELPPQRSYMHLDTVFTFIDHGLCLAHMPVIATGGPEAGHVYRIDLDRSEITYTLQDNLTSALSDVGLDIELVPCGGDDLIDQQREQWTDGANAFAIAPGVILLYERNHKTAEELRRRDFRLLHEQEVLEGAEVMGHGRTAILLRGNDLSRARGGPRCMTMPLERDSL